MTQYRAGNSGYKVQINQDWLTLDIGSGHNPHPRADVLVDKNIKDNTGRSGKPFKAEIGKPAIQANAEALPFASKAFDYVIASHVAEHVDDPENFCKEIMRVGKRGYIETPSKFAEILFDEPFHKWYVSKKHRRLVFEKIHTRRRLGLIGDVFYAVFYVNVEREGRCTIMFKNRCARFLSTQIVTWFLRKPMIKYAKLYTCFEWEGHFEAVVLRDKTG